MHIEIDLERLLKEKHKSKNFVCEECGLQRTQFNNYCKNKVSRVDLTNSCQNVRLSGLHAQ